MGGLEAWASAYVEPPLGYHPSVAGILTVCRYPGTGHCQVGSLTGAVASKSVTEAPKGSLRMVGNHPQSVKAEGSLTARQTCRADAKAGLSDQAVEYGIAVA